MIWGAFCGLDWPEKANIESGLILDTIVKANKEKYELNLIEYMEGKNKKW